MSLAELTSAADLGSFKHKEVVQAKLELPVRHEPEVRLGEDAERVRRHKAIVLMHAHTVDNA